MGFMAAQMNLCATGIQEQHHRTDPTELYALN